ncbi:ATP synthase protein I [Billgrantia gudaonensis]|uniref:ATP synthase protein I n=2 Tax=Billgrantia gudaonensis TaxID=376427 RepID=A0A1G8PDM6_9GAMM|nr:ATP synthase protein I [Halomonas gudaonensis]
MPRSAAMKRRRLDATRLLLAQGISTLLATGLGGLLAAWPGAASALLGGLTCLIPSLYFAWRVGSVGGGRQARRFVANVYRAEAGKFGLTVALFVVVFIAVPPSNPIFFFVAYVAVLFTHWLAPWLVRGGPAP